MDLEKMKSRLYQHIRLCRSNLHSSRVKCCATCPFEELIVAEYPDLTGMFRAKRKALNPNVTYPDDHN